MTPLELQACTGLGCSMPGPAESQTCPWQRGACSSARDSLRNPGHAWPCRCSPAPPRARSSHRLALRVPLLRGRERPGPSLVLGRHVGGGGGDGDVVRKHERGVGPVGAAPSVPDVGGAVPLDVAGAPGLLLGLHLAPCLEHPSMQGLVIDQQDVPVEAYGLGRPGERPLPPEICHVPDPQVIETTPSTKRPAGNVVPLGRSNPDADPTKLCPCVHAVGGVGSE
mmetsp:Transcript_60096/g.175594  ORF Transcript_60096/g.175594 Transcript_60096/m.175594 type:complete len:224 (-) Transcript_60096:693-1364(-)